MGEGRRGRYRQIGAVLRRHGLGVATGMIGLASRNPPPPGGTGLPLDLEGHAAKVLSRR